LGELENVFGGVAWLANSCCPSMEKMMRFDFNILK